MKVTGTVEGVRRGVEVKVGLGKVAVIVGVALKSVAGGVVVESLAASIVKLRGDANSHAPQRSNTVQD